MSDRDQEGVDKRLEGGTITYENQNMENNLSIFDDVNVAVEQEEKIQQDIGTPFGPLQYCLDPLHDCTALHSTD